MTAARFSTTPYNASGGMLMASGTSCGAREPQAAVAAAEAAEALLALAAFWALQLLLLCVDSTSVLSLRGAQNKRRGNKRAASGNQ